MTAFLGFSLSQKRENIASDVITWTRPQPNSSRYVNSKQTASNLTHRQYLFSLFIR